MGGKTAKRVICFLVVMVAAFLIIPRFLENVWVLLGIGLAVVIGIPIIILMSEGKGKDTRDAEEILDDISKKLDKRIKR